MAVRHFDYEQTKNTMQKIQNLKSKVQKNIDNVQSIVNENVCVENRWTGTRAREFKSNWEKTSSSFKEFVDIIDQYAQKVEQSYKAHQSFEQK